MRTGYGDFVSLNGTLVPAHEARLSVFDRGLLFAHAAYEVTAVMGGRLVDFDGHVRRLERTLAALAIPSAFSASDWEAMHQDLLRANQLEEGIIYLQVTAGDYAGRDFSGPETLTPNIFLFSEARRLIGEGAEKGVAAISYEDTRWSRRDLKTTQLLSQALAYRAAREAGAFTAIMHEDGVVTEAASANLWIVTAKGEIVTRDLSSSILAGITRGAVREQAMKAGLDVVERAFSLEDLHAATEAFTSSAGALILPLVRIDDTKIGDGTPGLVTRGVQARYYDAIGIDVGRRAPWASVL
jgi:D-alanine transaminase